MSYHKFNNLAEYLNGELVAKIGQGIISSDLMDRECNCYLPYKVNSRFVYEGKCRQKCLIYEVKLSMCDAIYIGNTQQIIKKRMGGHFFDVERFLKNEKNRLICSPFRIAL